MATRPQAADANDRRARAETRRPSATLPRIDLLAGGPCRCLPDPQGDWLPCAYCGLKQAPGKDFCGYCGHRWVTAEP